MLEEQAKQIQVIMSKIRRFSELVLIGIALALWFLIAPAIRAFSPTAAIFDAGVLMAFVYSIIGLITFFSTAWGVIYLRFPAIYKFLDERISHNFDKLGTWQKVKAGFTLLLSLCFLQALLVLALL